MTNSFHSDWEPELFAQIHSLDNTAQRQGIYVVDAISVSLSLPLSRPIDY